MGAGKSTFARALLDALGLARPPEGSPTFAIAHEYPRLGTRGLGAVVHIDFYRLKSEAEIEDAGIETYYWERDAIVISEWLSLWPTFERSVVGAIGDRSAWRVRIEIEPEDRRAVTVERLP